jgi:hypothetical protein
VVTPLGVSCNPIRDPGSDLTAWTNSFQNIQCYDTLKVNAILNEIDGKNHLGTNADPGSHHLRHELPGAQRGPEAHREEQQHDRRISGCSGTPGAALLSEFQFVDASIGAFVNELKKQGLYDSTLIVITAKHGQSPIDPSRYVSQLINGTSPVTLLSNAGYIPFSESTNNPTGIGPTEDDVSLVWLSNSSDTLAAVSILEANASRCRNRAWADLLRPFARA